MSGGRDHGGGLDAAIVRFGGNRASWLDLSTGINPVPYPLPKLPAGIWTDLPDRAAQTALINAARRFWRVPEGAEILATPGASAPIAQIPTLARSGRVVISGPTYNEHAAAFLAAGWQVVDTSPETAPDAMVVVHPNNPDGRLWDDLEIEAPLTVIDESFGDAAPSQSLIRLATRPGTLVLKSFGKFWGLAGMRLGFVIGDAALISRLRDALGPWPVSGPALHIGALALADSDWADATRARLASDAARLDRLLVRKGARSLGGTTLFRLYEVGDAVRWHENLARAHILSRIFPYNRSWLRLGLPAQSGWARLEAGL